MKDRGSKMDLTILREFFVKNVNRLCSQRVKEYKNKVDKELFERTYEHLIQSIGQDLIRILLPEFNLFIQRYNIKSGKMQQFCNYIITEDFFDYLYKKYALLEDKIVRKINDIFTYAEEIEKHFYEDKEQLSYTFKYDFNKIMDICLGEGDLHDGKSACKVITDIKTLYYKPTSGNSTTLFYKVLDFLMQDTDIKDKRVNYYTRDNHTWMETVQHKDCDTIEEVREYYYVSGIYLFAFYILSSYDMHHENIISNGLTPVVVDFETLTLLSTNYMKAEKYKESVNSVINTLFIPFISESGAYDVNMSGILSDTCKSSKEYYDYIVDEDGIKTEKRKVEVVIDNQVTLNGKKVVDKYIQMEEIRILLHKGFVDASKQVINNKQAFKEIINNFLRLNFVEFRQLLRPTEVYGNFVFALNNPVALMSQKETNKILMILQNNFKPSNFGYIRVEAEIKSIKKGYIPKFYVTYDSTDLYSNGKIICKEYFCETVQEKINGKVDSLDQSTVDYQLGIIDLSFLILLKQSDFGISIVNGSPKGKINDLYVKERIRELIEYFKRQEIRYAKQEITTFLAPHLADSNGMWRVREIDSNLYEYGGIVLVFAYFGVYYNDIKSIEFSIRILDYFNAVPERRSSSIFSGSGSLLYLNKIMVMLLEKIEGYEEKVQIYKEKYIYHANAVLDEILDGNLIPEDFDFIKGKYTNVYLLCKMCNKCTEDEMFKTKLKKVKDKVISEFDKVDLKEIGYAHGITGVSLILSEIYHVFPDKELKVIINKLVLRENILIESMGIENLPNTWCRGTSGILLGRKLISENILVHDKENREMIQNILKFQDVLLSDKSIKKMLSIENLCVCHGVYGNIEILKKLGEWTKYEEYICTTRFNKFEDINWLNRKVDVPIQSFMLGNLGIAYVLLELVSNSIPCFLTLDVELKGEIYEGSCIFG